MKIEPKAALDALINLLQRCPLTQAEAIGASQCIDVLKAAIDPQPPVKSE